MIKENIDLTKVYSTYTGQQGCACGCRGTYKYASAHAEFATSNRGYQVGTEETSDRSIKLVVNSLNNNKSDVVFHEFKDDKKVAGCYEWQMPSGRVRRAYVKR